MQMIGIVICILLKYDTGTCIGNTVGQESNKITRTLLLCVKLIKTVFAQENGKEIGKRKIQREHKVDSVLV